MPSACGRKLISPCSIGCPSTVTFPDTAYRFSPLYFLPHPPTSAPLANTHITTKYLFIVSPLATHQLTSSLELPHRVAIVHPINVLINEPPPGDVHITRAGAAAAAVAIGNGVAGDVLIDEPHRAV